LLPSSPLDEAHYHNDDGNHQYDMDEPSHRVTGYQPQQPQNYQYYSNCPQHMILLSDFSFPLPVIVSSYQPTVSNSRVRNKLKIRRADANRNKARAVTDYPCDIHEHILNH
jgi:hypothetical protein